MAAVPQGSICTSDQRSHRWGSWSGQRPRHQWHRILCSNPQNCSTHGFLSPFLTHTLKYSLRPFPPPTCTTLKGTKVWYSSSRVRSHWAGLLVTVHWDYGFSNFAKACRDLWHPPSLSAQPVRVPDLLLPPGCLLLACGTLLVTGKPFCLQITWFVSRITIYDSVILLYFYLQSWEGGRKTINMNWGLLHAGHFTYVIPLSYIWCVQGVSSSTCNEESQLLGYVSCPGFHEL